MITDTLKIRPMNRPEVDLAIKWAAIEGWNPGIYDAESYYQTDPQGFFLGELNGEPIGCISAVAYDEYFGFLGFYIVKPEYRGRGFGLKLWQAAMDYLGTNRNIGLDGVIAQQENYKKSGFHIAYKNIRYQRTGGGVISSDIVLLDTVPFEELVAYDRQFFPAERRKFLQNWLNLPNSAACGILNDGHLTGYGVVRRSESGYRIGPLFADNEEIAEKILQALLTKGINSSVFIDIPDIHSQAMALVQRHQMQPGFETARMYTKGTPDLPMSRIFGVTSLELG
jgi:ribosomal protein S18 acetylase RimI-like enzyme